MEPTLDDFKRWVAHELPLAKEGCSAADYTIRKAADYRYDALLGAQRALQAFEEKGRPHSEASKSF